MKDTSYYQHFIGGIYEKLNEAIHSETGEAFVVYQRRGWRAGVGCVRLQCSTRR
jgi:hypothetical protein